MNKLLTDEIFAWDMYFASLVGIQMHPANQIHPDDIELEPFARLADQMIQKRKERLQCP